MKLLVALVALLHVSQHALGEQVEVYDDEESVLLPCQVTVTDPQFNSVLWNVERLSDKIVHLRLQRGDILEDQNRDYRGRTSMRTDALTTGDLSLTLKNPTIRDSETYICIYREAGLDKRRQEVHLKVTERPPPPTPPGVIAGYVLVGLLFGAVGAAVGLWVYMKLDGGRVQQVKVKESGKESVLLSFRWTDRWWVRMRMCRICCNLPEDVRVEWMDKNDRKVHVYKNGSVEQDQDYRGRTEMKKDLMKTGDFSLKLRDITVTDSGYYTCRVYNKDGDFLRETRVELKVTDQQVEEVKEVEEESGAESVLLPFKTTPDVPEDVIVEWTYRNNRKVHVYQNGSVEQDQVYRGRTETKNDLKTGNLSLTLKHPTEGDTGEYFCRIYNKEGVFLRKRIVVLKVKGQEVDVEKGEESVLLSFKTTANLPGDVRVEWTDRANKKVHVYQNGSVQQEQVYRGRTEMNEDLKTGDFSLILRDITDTDSGFYTCRVYNKDGVLLRETRVALMVIGQPVKAVEGKDSVLLSFKTTAKLPEDVKVEWRDRNNKKVHVYRNGSVEQDQVYRDRTEMKKDLKTGDFSLTLRKPRDTDRGYYYCRIYNKDGDLLRERRVDLQVTEKKEPSSPGREEDGLMGGQAV